jgi:hypothetical protein
MSSSSLPPILVKKFGFFFRMSIGGSLIFPGEPPMEQEKLPGTCFELPVGFRDGVAVYDLEENPRELLP